jgi:hypothetical protein
MVSAAGGYRFWLSKDWPMNALLRFASVFLIVPLVIAALPGSASAGYKIPDDCLGDWEYCKSLWIRHFDRFGPEVFNTPFFEEHSGAIGGREGISRFSCREGREIIAARGFQHVSILKCGGRTYTYLARRNGETFRIFVSPRSGRISNMDRVSID